MAIPEFYRPPSKKELREYSQVNLAEKRKKLSDWIKELRNIQKADPEEAKQYLPPKELLKRFYEEVAEVYKDSPFSKEEIEDKFSSENLSQLNLEEYVELLKKVPPRFILHITRQGVRDRASFHSGRGEVSHGFEQILENGEIKSVLERHLSGVIAKDSIHSVLSNYLEIPQNYPTRREAAVRINNFLTRHGGTNLASSEIADTSALHTSMDYVADDNYGGELTNEIFFLYPTAYVASQYRVAAQWDIPPGFNMKDSTMSGQFNDLWLKAKSNNAGAMPIDAAIVFVPENANVDPNTGSRYKIEKGEPVSNTEQIEKVKFFIESVELKDLWPRVSEALRDYQNVVWEITQIQKSLKITKSDDEREKLDTKLSVLQSRMEELKKVISELLQKAQDFGILDKRFYERLGSATGQEFESLYSLLALCEREKPFAGIDNWEIDEKIASTGLSFQLADPEKTVSSRQYWEQYFQRVGKQPSKIIFYDQATPNEAMNAFRQHAGISDSQHKEIDLKNMFSENIFSSNKGVHDAMQREREIFAQYAEELLDEFYPVPEENQK